MEKKIRFFLLVGIPCSGKSTWVKEESPKLSVKYNAPVIVISRDAIRLGMSKDGKYRYSAQQEKEVTEKFYHQLSNAVMLENVVIILDNTHLHIKYVRQYLIAYRSYLNTNKMQFFIKMFHVPYWKAYIRNIRRNILTQKWIPIKVLKDFHERYTNLDLSQFKEYFYE